MQRIMARSGRFAQEKSANRLGCAANSAGGGRDDVVEIMRDEATSGDFLAIFSNGPSLLFSGDLVYLSEWKCSLAKRPHRVTLAHHHKQGGNPWPNRRMTTGWAGSASMSTSCAKPRAAVESWAVDHPRIRRFRRR